ncbi:hypothetical protein LQW54_001484 [Pestalotiopsis sp. IQ-011]
MLTSEAKQAYEEEYGAVEEYGCDCDCGCGVAEEDWDDHVSPIEHDRPEDPDKSKQNAYTNYKAQSARQKDLTRELDKFNKDFSGFEEDEKIRAAQKAERDRRIDDIVNAKYPLTGDETE